MCETENCRCVKCDGVRDAADMLEVNGEMHCDDCACVCEGCSENILTGDAVENRDGDKYCEECYSETYYTCEGCSDEITHDDAYMSENGDGPYCESCFDDLFTRCCDCGCELLRDSERSFTSACGDWYCESCYNEAYTTCDDCGREVSSGDTYTDEDGDGAYCARCYREAHADNWEPRPVGAAKLFDEIKSQRRFGVELETHDCEGYTSARGETVFGAKDDGSIDGKEFISPPLQGDEGLDHVRKFCRLARSWHVNNACGYHLHLDMSHECLEGVQAIAYAYAMSADLWTSFVPKSRRANQYCEPIDFDGGEIYGNYSLNDFRSWAGHRCRYKWFNVASYVRHSTFEIRLHTGTLDKEKITNWIKAHVRFADWASTQTRCEIRRAFAGTASERFNKLAAIIGDDVAAFYRERAEEFGTVYHQPAVVA